MQVDVVAPRRRRWVGRAAIAASALALCVVAVAAIRHQAEQRWRELLVTTTALEGRLDAESAARPVLHGDAIAGAAHPHYQRAVAAVEALGIESGNLARILRQQACLLAGQPFTEKVADKPTAAELVGLTAPAIDALAAGAHSPDGRPPIQWDKGLGHPTGSLLAARDLANVALLHAITAAAAGDHAGAARAWLDVLQYGRDTMDGCVLITEMVGVALVAIGAREVTVALLQQLDAAALRTMQRGLAALDAALPLVGRSLEGETLLLVRHFRHFGWRAFEIPRWQTWRYALSPQIAVAAHATTALAFAEQVRALAADPGGIDFGELERRYRALAQDHNPVTRRMSSNSTKDMPRGLAYRLDGIAQVRVLRMAVQHQLGETVEALRDPLGGVLRVQVDPDGRATFWSDADRKSTLLELPPRTPK